MIRRDEWRRELSHFGMFMDTGITMTEFTSKCFIPYEHDSVHNGIEDMSQVALNKWTQKELINCSFARPLYIFEPMCTMRLENTPRNEDVKTREYFVTVSRFS